MSCIYGSVDDCLDSVINALSEGWAGVESGPRINITAHGTRTAIHLNTL